MDERTLRGKSSLPVTVHAADGIWFQSDGSALAKAGRPAANGGSAARADGIDVSAGTVPPFRERAPWFGGDLQTLRNAVRGTPPDLPGGERLLLPVSGGDRLAARLDRPDDRSARPLIVLVHGLAGSEASGNVVASMRHLVGQGWPVLRLNLRGALPSCPTAAGHYHAGRTEDLAEALRGLPADFIRHGIVVLGHSLGGNLVLKFMGEGGHGLPVLAAVAVSTPIDLAATCARMMTRRNFVYHRYMLDAMKREALAQGAAVSATERAAIAALKTVYEFDDRFIAPRFGYRDAQDYYESNAAKNFLASSRGRRSSCTRWTTLGFQRLATLRSTGRACR